MPLLVLQSNKLLTNNKQMDITNFIDAVNNKDTAGIIENGNAILREVNKYVKAAKKFEDTFNSDDEVIAE